MARIQGNASVPCPPMWPIPDAFPHSLFFAIQEKMRIFAVDKSTEYHEVINGETAIFASKVVQLPLK